MCNCKCHLPPAPKPEAPTGCTCDGHPDWVRIGCPVHNPIDLPGGFKLGTGMPAEPSSDAGQAEACYGDCGLRKCPWPVGHDRPPAPSEPAKAPLSERMRDSMVGTVPPVGAYKYAEEVAALEARLAKTQESFRSESKERHYLTERLAEVESQRDAWESRAEAEKARDEAMQRRRWQRNFDESAKRERALRVERDEAIRKSPGRKFSR